MKDLRRPNFAAQQKPLCLAGVVSSSLTIWGYIEIGCLPAITGPNVYGPDPLAPARRANAWSH
jgi:uncharacterized membrane protein YhaH (DUF805 family)